MDNCNPTRIEDWKNHHVYEWARKIIRQEDALRLKDSAAEGIDIVRWNRERFESIGIPTAMVFRIMDSIAVSKSPRTPSPLPPISLANGFSFCFLTNLRPDPLEKPSFELDPRKPACSIHESVSKAVGGLWDLPCYQKLSQAIEEHLISSPEVEKAKLIPGLDDNLIGSLVYYTADVQKFGGEKDQNISHLLNIALCSQETDQLEDWMPFLYYILESQKKLPSINCFFFFFY